MNKDILFQYKFNNNLKLDNKIGAKETDVAIEIGSKIAEKYGYHQGVESADSTDVFREEYVDEGYRFERE